MVDDNNSAPSSTAQPTTVDPDSRAKSQEPRPAKEHHLQVSPAHHLMKSIKVAMLKVFRGLETEDEKSTSPSAAAGCDPIISGPRSEPSQVAR